MEVLYGGGFTVYRSSLVPRLLPMRYAGKRLAADSKFFGAVFWNVGIPIRLASWINHVTSHALTMVTHLRQKTK